MFLNTYFKYIFILLNIYKITKYNSLHFIATCNDLNNIWIVYELGVSVYNDIIKHRYKKYNTQVKYIQINLKNAIYT